MKNHNRRDFIKQVSATGAVLATGAFVSCAEKASASCSGAGTEENIQSKLIIPKAQVHVNQIDRRHIAVQGGLRRSADSHLSQD